MATKTPSPTCTCQTPIPIERAVRKGAAYTVCMRCDLRIPARLR